MAAAPKLRRYQKRRGVAALLSIRLVTAPRPITPPVSSDLTPARSRRGDEYEMRVRLDLRANKSRGWVRGGEGLASSPPPIHQPRCRDIPAARGRGICADAAGVSSGRDAFGCLGHPAQPTATGMMVRLPSRQDWMLLNRGIQPACTMLLEAVDVAPVKAIPKGARTA
jgi:hypothetical protein